MTKPLPPTFFMTALVVAVVLHFILPLRQLISLPWTLFGLLPLVLGGALNLLADRDLMMEHTTVKPFEESASLVVAGAYGISRNPMYLGMTLILFGVAVLLGSLSPFISAPVFAVVVNRVFVVPEERMLAATFGERFAAYCRQVRRWI